MMYRRIKTNAPLLWGILGPAFIALAGSAMGVGPGDSDIVSDDFSSATLNGGLWAGFDPIGDGTIQVTGSQVELTVPQGTLHDVWTNGNDSVRIMQPASNTDFEVDVKFESSVTEKFQLQGIIVEQDAANAPRSLAMLTRLARSANNASAFSMNFASLASCSS